MMKKFVYLFIAALFVGFAGCKHEQSELDFGSLQEKALVTGHVTYSLGVDTLSNDYVAEKILPAVGRKIYVEVPMSSYQAGSQGNKIFTGVVDSLGNFSIEVPVKTEGIDGAKLRYETFTAQRAKYLKMEGGKPVFEVRMCKFKTPEAIATLPTLKPGSNEIGTEDELRYEWTVIDMKDYSETAVFTGKLLLPYEVSYHTGAYKAAADCAVEITIQDGEDLKEKPYDAPTFTYGCTTDKDGVFAVNLPIKNLREGFYVVEAKVVPKDDAEFVHYTDVTGKSMKVAGAYVLREGGFDINSVVDEVVAGVDCNIGECPLKFEPGYNNGIADREIPPAWNDDLAGWVFGEQAFANMTATAKLTGSIKLAKEDAFAVGSYTTSAQSIIVSGKVYPYDKAFAVLTKADGTFELDIPVEQEGVNPGGIWEVEQLIQPTSIAFTHYESATKSIVIKEGKYDLYKNVRTADADWNQLGDHYYQFAPASPSTIDKWSSELAGWVIMEDYNEKVTLTSKIYLATETALAIGEYKGAEGHRAVVNVDYDPEGNISFVVPVQADGTVSVVIPAKEATSKYENYTIGLLDVKTEDFVHYTKKGSEKREGEYKQEYKFEDKDADWNNKWTYYYKFDPKNHDGWYSNLAGWIKVEGYNYSATATGKAMFAKEDSYAKGSYKAAANEVVTITANELPGLEFQVPVKADGSFSVKLPLKDAADEYELAVGADNVTVDDFVHYRDHGKIKTLKGTYVAQDPIKAEDAAWNNLGTYYFKFEPDLTVHPDLDTYTDKLFGWQKYDESKFPNKDMMITGTIRYAEETGFWKGTYVPYANEKVTVEYDLHSVHFEMVVLSDADGVVECQAYRTFGDDAPEVSVTPMMTNTENYVHYYHVTSPATEKVGGYYYHHLTDKAATAKWNNAGTKYYKFQPTTTVHDWSDNLVGWYVVPQKKDNAQFKLYAQKAYETSTSNNHEAKWMNAGNVKAHVTVGSRQFDMAVSGKNLSFTMPTASEIEDGVTAYNVTIELVDEPENSTQFTHYPDPAENTTEILIGNYQSVDNISYEVVTAEGKKFEIKESAKMMFYEQSYWMPSGYVWDYTAEHDAN